MLDLGVERVTLTDFGLARAADDASMTRTGSIAGTPQYMSPEQSRGEPLDARSDLFSLGSVLYEMSTAHRPFKAETDYGVVRRIAEDEPLAIREINAELPELPEWLEWIVERLHEKSPDDRIQTASEVAGLLEECLAHLQQPTKVPLPKTSPLTPDPSPPKRGEGSHSYVACSKSRRYRSARLGKIGNHKNRNVIKDLGTSARRLISPMSRP